MAKFEKGKSGNPGGRPRMPEDIKSLTRQHTPEAINVLAGIMNNAKASPAARVAAANAILDRAWGKPHQSVSAEVASREMLLELPLEERRRLLMERMNIKNSNTQKEEARE